MPDTNTGCGEERKRKKRRAVGKSIAARWGHVVTSGENMWGVGLRKDQPLLLPLSTGTL